MNHARQIGYLWILVGGSVFTNAAQWFHLGFPARGAIDVFLSLLYLGVGLYIVWRND